MKEQTKLSGVRSKQGLNGIKLKIVRQRHGFLKAFFVGQLAGQIFNGVVRNVETLKRATQKIIPKFNIQVQTKNCAQILLSGNQNRAETALASDCGAQVKYSTATFRGTLEKHQNQN